MNKFLTILSVSLLSACANNAQITNYESEGNLATTNPLSCVAATSITASNSAADITAGAKDCAQKSNYAQAAELIMVANAYAFYDTQRVTDKSAHGALNALFAKEFGALPETERQSLFASIDALDQNTTKKQEICSFLASSEPPTYMPSYMIAHGMVAFTGSVKEPLVQDFNPNESWAKAMEFVKCSS